MSETVSKAHHEAVVRGLSATIRAQAEELERLRAANELVAGMVRVAEGLKTAGRAAPEVDE